MSQNAGIGGFPLGKVNRGTNGGIRYFSLGNTAADGEETIGVELLLGKPHQPFRDQGPLFLVEVNLQRHDSGYRRVAVLYDHLFALTHSIEERTELVFELSNVDRNHMAIIAMLVAGSTPPTRCRIGVRYHEGMQVERDELQKVTVMLPKSLIEKATQISGLGLTPTLRKGLEKIVTAEVYARTRQLRGKVKFSINVGELRED